MNPEHIENLFNISNVCTKGDYTHTHRGRREQRALGVESIQPQANWRNKANRKVPEAALEGRKRRSNRRANNLYCVCEQSVHRGPNFGPPPGPTLLERINDIPGTFCTECLDRFDVYAKR